MTRRYEPAGIALAIAAALTPLGCVSSDARQRVAERHAQTLQTISNSYAMDLAALRLMTRSVLDIRLEAMRTGVEQTLLDRYITPAGDPDLDRLQRILEEPNSSAPDALSAGVISGELSPSDATRWLRRYALAWRQNEPAGARRELIDRLSSMREALRARDALLNDLDEHARTVADLLAESIASASALGSVIELDRELLDPASDALAAAWRRHVLDRIDNDDLRDALDDLIGPAVPSLTTTATEATP